MWSWTNDFHSLSPSLLSCKISSFEFKELKKCTEHNQRNFFTYPFIIIPGDRNMTLSSGNSGFIWFKLFPELPNLVTLF